MREDTVNAEATGLKGFSDCRERTNFIGSTKESEKRRLKK
jgi:hypothetical protein